MRRRQAPLPRSHRSRLFSATGGAALCLSLGLLLSRGTLAQEPGAAAPEQAATQAVEAPILRPYPILPAHEPRIIELQQQYASRPDVRIARDSRTSQLLVLAPSDVQAHIAQVLSAPPNTLRNPPRSATQPPSRLANGQSDEAAGQPVSPRPMPQEQAPGGQVVRRALQLTNLAVDDLHGRLQRLMGRPLPLQEDADQVNVQFAIDAAPGARISVAADRSSGRVVVTGRADLAESWARVISAMDTSDPTGNTVTRLVATRHAQKNHLRLVAQTLSAQPGGRAGARYAGPVTAEGQIVTRLFQPGGDAGGQLQPPANGQPPVVQPDDQQAEADEFDIAQAAAGLIGQVQIEYIEGLDILVIRGADQDVQQVMRLIEEIERMTQEAPLDVRVYPLQHVQSEALATLIAQVYEEIIVARQGSISITPLVKPNALLLIGRTENVDYVIESLIKKLDVDVPPATEFRVFFLEHAAALDVQTRIQQVYGEPTAQQAAAAQPTGLGTRVVVTADFRSNSLIVRAAPRDMREIAALIEELDRGDPVATMEVREFKLRNALATDLANVLLNALSTQAARTQGGGQQGGFQQQGFGGQQQGIQGGAGQQQFNQPRSTRVELLTVDAQGNRVVTETSGVLTDIRITPDDRSNALVVTAPRDSMGLIGALIERLDEPPDLTAEVKVFTVRRGDATAMAEMLRELFGQTTTGGGGGGFGGGGGGQFGQGLGAITTGESTLIPLRISVDERTNSIIASGTHEALAVVHAILLTLDAEDVRNRNVQVFKLKNLFSGTVANALNQWITLERQVEQAVPGAVSAIEQIEREAVIVAEEASNSLIVSATPELFNEIRRIVEQMDARPPMVMVQVFIAEVALNDTDEFGVELGIQDSILFDRSLLTNIMNGTTTTTTTTPGGGMTTVQETFVQAADLAPGFQFLNPLSSLGNSGSTQSIETRGKVGAQGLANFGVGRVNNDLGFGGFVFSAGSENLNLLLRALQESRRMEILSRPQIMALDNQFAVVQVGQRVPYVTSSTITAGVQQNQITFEEVGLILRVQPRVSPDGMVVMQIEAEKSDVGPEAEGIPITTSTTGEVVRAPRINRTFAGTIVQAISGQTIVLGGLISKETTDVHRRVPLIADIPIVGDLFRYDLTRESRNELLIIMTPRVVRNYLDAEMIKHVESARMHWVLSDVIELNGPSGLRGRTDHWGDAESEAIYPTHVPGEGEMILPPSGAETQGGPAQAPRPTTPTVESADLGPNETLQYDASTAGFQASTNQYPPAARQTAYDGLTPLPPTRQ